MSSDAEAAATRLEAIDRRRGLEEVRSDRQLTSPGLYAWFVDEPGAVDLARGLNGVVEAELIYAGQAGAGTSTATLGSRIRGNHIRGNTYGSTFRLTLATCLWHTLGLEPTGGRRMAPDGERLLSAWMAAHLMVATEPFYSRTMLDAFETSVLTLLDPPLNLMKMPPTALRSRLKELRRQFCLPSEAALPLSRRNAQVASPVMTGTSRGRYTPEGLARELGLPNAKGVRAFLRREFPRPAGDLWSRWPPLDDDMDRAVRRHFGRTR